MFWFEAWAASQAPGGEGRCSDWRGGQARSRVPRHFRSEGEKEGGAGKHGGRSREGPWGPAPRLSLFCPGGTWPKLPLSSNASCSEEPSRILRTPLSCHLSLRPVPHCLSGRGHHPIRPPRAHRRYLQKWNCFSYAAPLSLPRASTEHLPCGRHAEQATQIGACSDRTLLFSDALMPGSSLTLEGLALPGITNS